MLCLGDPRDLDFNSGPQGLLAPYRPHPSHRGVVAPFTGFQGVRPGRNGTNTNASSLNLGVAFGSRRSSSIVSPRGEASWVRPEEPGRSWRGLSTGPVRLPPSPLSNLATHPLENELPPDPPCVSYGRAVAGVGPTPVWELAMPRRPSRPQLCRALCTLLIIAAGARGALAFLHTGLAPDRLGEALYPSGKAHGRGFTDWRGVPRRNAICYLGPSCPVACTVTELSGTCGRLRLNRLGVAGAISQGASRCGVPLRMFLSLYSEAHPLKRSMLIGSGPGFNLSGRI
jgi:hypothetical protein